MSVSTQKESRSKDSGFTLIEIVLVVVIIGVMLVVIIPRANRARDAAKFNSIRQVSSELALWGMTWAERNLKVQPEDAESELIDYVDTPARICRQRSRDQLDGGRGGGQAGCGWPECWHRKP